MSNFEASKLYESVIEEVISDSRQDFEDSGIDESTLQELRKIWCQKLSATTVAKFSWDELALREEEEQRAEEAASIQHKGGNVLNGAPGDVDIQQSYDLTGTGDGTVTSGVDAKYTTDSFDTTGGLELPNIGNGVSQTLLYDHQSNGDDASVDGGIQIPGMGSNIKAEDDGTGLMFPKINQADGTIEFTFNADDEIGAQVFKSIRNKQKNQNKNNKNKSISQADGIDDFDDDDDDVFNDSDDINSDLDDEVESDREDDDVGQDEGQIMLCLYDKVQRIKNKWKSTLKEGVANINGRDYVFQKATGESEW